VEEQLKFIEKERMQENDFLRRRVVFRTFREFYRWWNDLLEEWKYCSHLDTKALKANKPCYAHKAFYTV
jgi:hypothetical protein